MTNTDQESGVAARNAKLESAVQELNYHLENIPLAVVQWSADLRIQRWSGQAARVFGWCADEVVNRGFSRLPFRTKDRQLIRRMVHGLVRGTGSSVAHRLQLQAKDRRAVTSLWYCSVLRDRVGHMVSVMALVEDLSEQVRIEQQFHQAQKMEAVGRLAGGIVHDFNNLLTVINGYCDLLARNPDAAPAVRDGVARVLEAGRRAAALTHQLLAFSRQQVFQPSKLDLNGVVEDIRHMLGRIIGEDVVLVLTLEPRLQHVEVDANQIGQVIVNLAVNARDAMPSGGRLIIETSNVHLDREFLSRQGGERLPAGEYVCLALSDTGTGVPPDVLPKIFEPFFTTKESGKGTGLGLATVYGILQQSGGLIDVETAPGGGTTFRVYLPAVAPTLPLSTAKPAARQTLGPANAAMVLVVEDDPMVREFVTEVLTAHGYQTLEAGTAVEAVSVSEGFAGDIHALITDLVLPAGRGVDVAERIRQMRPDVKILLISGYVDAGQLDGSQLASTQPLLRKPFTALDLLHALQEILGGA